MVTLQTPIYHIIKLPFMNELSYSLNELVNDVKNGDKEKRNDSFLKIIKKMRDYMSMLYDAAVKVNENNKELYFYYYNLEIVKISFQLIHH